MASCLRRMTRSRSAPRCAMRWLKVFTWSAMMPAANPMRANGSVNQAEFNGIAKSMVDSMVAEIGAEGRFAIITHFAADKTGAVDRRNAGVHCPLLPDPDLVGNR